MPVAEGVAIYNHGAHPCVGVGLSWTEEELDEALQGSVAATVFDDSGNSLAAELLSGLADTDFAQDNLAAALSASDSVEDWRIGEAIAETYLTDHRDCYFPWPDGRDSRKARSSLPGADLVGIALDDAGDCLAFGEVKTSGQSMYPPGVMNGRSGLNKQIEDLRDNEATKDGLLRYLCYRAKHANWRGRFEVAAKRYLYNKSDVCLYGILIRDVDPHGDDLRTRTQGLGNNCPNGTRIELMAIYLPSGSIDQLGTKVISSRAGGGS